MPNRWTFKIKPIAKLLEDEMGVGMFIKGVWADPFCGKFSPAQVTNDLNPDTTADFNMDALDFLTSRETESLDGVLYDPPYSPRQVQECYQSIGKDKFTAKHTRMDYWAECKNEIARILKPQGKAICFGWNSNGLGKGRGFQMMRILLVAHGGSKNDTICTVEVKD